LITEEQLNHWIKEIRYHLTGIDLEVQPDKFLSKEYIKEKATTIRGLTKCIEDDMK
jgi:hypothetical protein